MKERPITLAVIPDILLELTKLPLEALMRAEQDTFLAEDGGTKNRYYTRHLDTSLDRLQNLWMPRDQEGRFRIQT